MEYYVGDGSAGWPFFADATKGKPEKKTFDRIIVTAAVPKVPGQLIDQLGAGGVIVVPVGEGGAQELIVGTKKEGKLIERAVCDVRFVKLVGKHAFEE